MKRWLLLLTAFLTPPALAGASLVRMNLERGDATVPVVVMRHPQARATLILLPGGDAGTGRIIEGKPSSGNFLARSRELFFEQGFNVLVVFRPSDLPALDYGYRVSREHIAEIDKVISYAKQEFKTPVWLIGTSRGTVSGTAAAIELTESKIDGLVLTSSVTNRKPGAIATQRIADIKMPVLVVHHKNDACKICVPNEAARIIDGLKSAQPKKFVMIEGGANPEGDACEAMHWHGFINFEKETVKLITDWIKNPST